MKLFTFIVLAVMLVATTALAAAEVPTSRGDKAMVFMFNGLAYLSTEAYGQYGFGMRYYIADGTAVRLGVQFGKDTFKDDDFNDEYKDSVYGVNAVYERHLAGPCSSVSPYWGIGAGYTTYSYLYEDDFGNTWTDSGTGFAGFGVMGFEWGFTDCLTLGGEYMLGFESWSSDTEADIGGVTTTYNEYSGTFMGFGTASVYLSVYW
jgi:hypothetical protein